VNFSPRGEGRASAEYLQTVKEFLSRQTDQELAGEYNKYLEGCGLKDGKPPDAWWIQFLVQAWREIRRRRNGSAP
jgi:hypothetical protein